MTVAIEAAREAGDFLRASHRTDLRIETKPDNSLVTNVDREAERLIVAKIEAAFPGHDIIGEERARTNRGSDHTWVIDPLDGTHNYIRGMETYGVSIGVLRGNVFAAGVIFMPQIGELYSAERGSGAFRNGARIRVSVRSELPPAPWRSTRRCERRRTASCAPWLICARASSTSECLALRRGLFPTLPTESWTGRSSFPTSCGTSLPAWFSWKRQEAV